MNQIFLIGRITKDPELKTTNTGKSNCTFTLAVDRDYKQEGQPTADFFRCITWDNSERGGSASFVADYLKKGSQCAVIGRLQSREYETEGLKKQVWEVIVTKVKGLDSRKAGESSGSQPGPTGSTAPAAGEYDPFADQ